MAEEINNNVTEPTTTVVEESVSMADYEKLKAALAWNEQKTKNAMINLFIIYRSV